MSENAQAKTYKSNTERLMSLPKIFRGSDLINVGITNPDSIKQYLSRWKKANLINGLGGRTDVFFNALCFSGESWEEEATLLLAPGAIQTGIGPLHKSGWTTQRHNKIEVSAPIRAAFTSNHVKLYCRPMKWFRTAVNGLQKQKVTPIDSLRPAWALADLWFNTDPYAWKPKPDDLDFIEMEEHVDDFIAAISAFAPVYLGKEKAKAFSVKGDDFYDVYMNFTALIKKVNRG